MVPSQSSTVSELNWLKGQDLASFYSKAATTNRIAEEKFFTYGLI